MQKNHLQKTYPFPQADLEAIVEKVLCLAKSAGADSAETSLSEERGFQVTARLGDVETLEHHQQKTLTVTVYKDYCSGSASTTDLSLEAIQKTVDKAFVFAQNASKDPYSGLADPEHLAVSFPDLLLYNYWDLTPKQAIEQAVLVEEMGRQQDQRIISSDGVGIKTFSGLRLYANSHGFLGSYLSSYHGVHCGLVAKEGDEMQREYEYTVARDPSDLDDFILLAKRAAEKTLMRLGAQKIKTQHCPIVFHAPAAKSLLSAFVSAISGSNLRCGTSFLLDHLDKAVFPNHIHLYQKPHLLKGMGSAPFDSEGVRTENRDYVVDGVLKSYVLGSYSARKLAMQTTGNAGGVFNLCISNSDINFQSLLEQMGTGFLVTELIGQGVNILTGDYSRGAAGFWVEQGSIQHAVHEVTIAGNLRDIFRGVVAIANDVDHRGNIHTGSILIDHMMLAGQ